MKNKPCSICRQPISKRLNREICSDCREGLTYFGNQIRLLIAAADYLARKTANPVCDDGVSLKTILESRAQFERGEFVSLEDLKMEVLSQKSGNPDYSAAWHGITQLKIALESTPIESGVSHPAEGILHHCIQENPDRTYDWINSLFDEASPNLLANVITCAGRLPPRLFQKHALSLITKALLHNDPEVRESAVSAVEQWETPELLQLLRSHSDTLPWLERYARKVAEV